MKIFIISDLIKGASAALLIALSAAAFSQEPQLPCDELEQDVLEETAQDEVALVTEYTPAVVISREHPKYPENAARAGAEGWVQMSYVIDENGQVKDPEIQDYGGDRAFKNAALRAIKRWQFSPAIKNGKPTEQCASLIRFDFFLDGKPGASRKFINTYKKVARLLEEGDIDAADDAIKKLHSRKENNRYENAWLWNIDSQIANKKKQTKREINALRRTIQSAVGHSDEARTFNDNNLSYMHYRLFLLQADEGLYADALATSEDIASFDNGEAIIEKLQSTIDNIKAFLGSDQNLFIDKKIGSDGKIFHRLARNRFAFVDIKGDLDTVEVRCETKREKYTIAEDHIWELPATWGDCVLMVKGDDDAEFALVEVAQSQQ